jgi:hypothetical protein
MYRHSQSALYLTLVLFILHMRTVQYGLPWTSYDCPFLTHSSNVHPYSTPYALFECQPIAVRPSNRPWPSYHCPYVTHSYKNVQPNFTLWTLFECQSTVQPTMDFMDTTIHMLHTLIMSILTSGFGHSSNVNQLYDQPWTSYDCPYVTHSANVHPYFMIWTLCECPCTFLRLLFCPTP